MEVTITNVPVNEYVTIPDDFTYCPHCSNPPYSYIYHYGGRCPEVREIEYYPDGSLKKIVYK